MTSETIETAVHYADNEGGRKAKRWDEIMRLWKAHGGDQHGPRIETVTMPLSKFRDFMDAAEVFYPPAALSEPAQYVAPNQDSLIIRSQPVAPPSRKVRRTAMSNVTVKPLIWKEEATPRHHYANSIVGDYGIIGVTANANYRLYRDIFEIKPAEGYYWPFEDAKAAAQADYEARIISEIEVSE